MLTNEEYDKLCWLTPILDWSRPVFPGGKWEYKQFIGTIMLMEEMVKHDDLVWVRKFAFDDDRFDYLLHCDFDTTSKIYKEIRNEIKNMKCFSRPERICCRLDPLVEVYINRNGNLSVSEISNDIYEYIVNRYGEGVCNA